MDQESVWSRIGVFVAAAMVCLGLLAFESLGWLSGIKAGVQNGLKPVMVVGEEITQVIGNPIEMVRFYRHGVERLADMEARLAEALVEQEEIKRLKEENERMRYLLSADVPASWHFEPVRVIARTDNEWLIDAGDRRGVNKGMMVMEDEIFLGVVGQVSEAVSQVELAGVGNASLEVKTVFGSRGILKRDQGKLWIEQVLQADRLEPGDRVITLGNIQVSEGVVVGVVGEVELEESDVYKRAVVDWPVVERQGDIVFLVRGKS